MNRRSMLTAPAVALPLALVASGTAAQTMKSVAGSYAPVDVPAFGDKPRGLLTLGADGRYSLILARAKLNKMASGARTQGTPDEYKSVVDGTIAHFGKYTIDDGGKAITFHIETSTFPNWDGTTQKRQLRVDKDELRYVVAAPSTGSGKPSELVWRRVK
jgi:hypothetical protein